MADDRLIESYLAELARQLPGSPESRARVLDEVRDHLLAAVAREQTLGAPRDEAVRRAVARFGGPKTIGCHFVALSEEQGVVVSVLVSKIVGWLALAASAYYAWFFLAVRPAQGALVAAVLLAGSGLVALLVRPPSIGGVGWFRDGRPATWAGWLSAGLVLVLLAAIFVSVDRGSHSSSDTLIGSIPLMTPVAVLALLLARAVDAARPAAE